MRGRQLAHAIRGGLAVAVGTLSLLAESPRLNRTERQDVAQARAALDNVLLDMEALHNLVRTLSPEQHS